MNRLLDPAGVTEEAAPVGRGESEGGEREGADPGQRALDESGAASLGSNRGGGREGEPINFYCAR